MALTEEITSGLSFLESNRNNSLQLIPLKLILFIFDMI